MICEHLNHSVLYMVVQDSQEKHTDFYVRECPRGTLLFESIVFPQEVIKMSVGKKKNKRIVNQFSVFLLVN